MTIDVQGTAEVLYKAARTAIAGAVAAIEIVDSRIDDWKIKLPDTIADMASSGAVVLSSRLVPLDDTLRRRRRLGMEGEDRGTVVHKAS